MSKGGSSSNTSTSQTQTTTPTAATLSALTGNLTSAQNLSQTGYSPLTGGQITGLLSPYLSSAVGSTAAAIENQREQEIAQNGLSAAASGDYNSTGRNVENALTSQLSGQTLASTVSQMENQGFQQAENTAETQNQAQNNFPLALQALLNSATQTQAAAGGSTTSGSGTQKQNSTNYSLNLSNVLSGTAGSPLGPLAFAI